MYLDDGVVGGVLADVKEDRQIFVNCEAKTGLSLNLAKCELILLVVQLVIAVGRFGRFCRSPPHP